ncbi:MAG: hypothetical protein INR73_17375 [Williamsia sp.]|nr:hypothetical protein [Williamsia sp.]
MKLNLLGGGMATKRSFTNPFSSNLVGLYNRISKGDREQLELLHEYSKIPALKKYIEMVTDDKTGDIIEFKIDESKKEKYLEEKIRIGVQP